MPRDVSGKLSDLAALSLVWLLMEEGFVVCGGGCIESALEAKGVPWRRDCWRLMQRLVQNMGVGCRCGWSSPPPHTMTKPIPKKKFAGIENEYQKSFQFSL